jgi:hypothetical protein
VGYSNTAEMNKTPKLTMLLALVGGLTLANASIGQSFAYTASSEKTMYGHFTLIVKDEFGNIKDYIEVDNVITDEGDECIATLSFAGATATCAGSVIDTVAIADCEGVACAAVSDTTTTFDDADNVDCGDNAKVGATTSTWSTGPNKVRLSATFATGDTGLGTPYTAREAGILNSAGGTCVTADELFAIKTFADVTIAGADTLTVNYDVTFAG